MNPSTQFLYNFGNLEEYSPSLTHVIVAIILGIICIISLRILFGYIAGISLVYHDHKIIEDKKHVLGDLILMKDIQTELEREIEQATFKATFQG